MPACIALLLLAISNARPRQSAAELMLRFPRVRDLSPCGFIGFRRVPCPFLGAREDCRLIEGGVIAGKPLQHPMRESLWGGKHIGITADLAVPDKVRLNATWRREHLGG